MANRRMGGMGGPHRGNRSFSQHQPFQGNNVNPWQGNSNNSMNPGLISSPQQLALALTSLLQPQQANNPPSLLSLNTSPGSFNQDRELSRFGNRGRDFRRHEPYNKNRNGWRTMDNRGNNNRRNNNKDRKNNIKDNKKKDEKKVEEKKENAETSVDETNEEGDAETKRDWKAEKNTAEDNKDEVANDNKDNKENNKDGKYFGVPQKFLNCFVCNKEMWDGESMQKHIRGRAHKQMLNSLEESIHCTVKILRENMRLQEEKKLIEFNRMSRLKKFSRFQEVASHCNMCDLKFLGKITAHRKTEGHQRLKRYLHPNCNMCDKEFPSRMEWVEHRLTPEHLRSLNTTLEKKEGGGDGDVIIKEEELDIEPLLDEPLQLESEKPILELTEDLAGLQNLIPAYKKTRAVSTQSLQEFSGFACDLCNRSFVNNDLAQAHLKTRRHYYAFIEAAKKKYQKNVEEEKKKKEAETAAKKDVKAEDVSQDMYDPEEACNEEEENSLLKDDEEEEETKPDANGTEPMDTTEEGEKEESVEAKAEEKASPGRPQRKTNVKNGAGPRSKKARKQ